MTHSITNPSDRQTVNVALVGYGFAGKSIHAPLIMSVPGLRLHTIVSRSHTQVRIDDVEPRVVPEPDTAFADPDIQLVVIATPNAVHASLAHAALSHGKDVVVDKPFTVTVDEACELVTLAERTGRRLTVFHNRRLDSDFLTIRKLVADDVLGEIVEWQAFSDRYRPQVRDRWRERAEPGAGIWFDLGSHLVDQALHLCGAPRAVSADIGIQRPGGVVDDYFHVRLRYDRLRILLHGSSIAPAHTLRCIVHGTMASYIKDGWDPQEPMLRGGGRPGGPDWGVDPNPGRLTTVVDDVAQTVAFPAEPGDYRRFYAAMRDAVLLDAPVPVLPRDAIAVMEILDLAMRSAKEGRELPYEPR